MPDPEQITRQEKDSLLGPCGWVVHDKRAANLAASLGVAEHELTFKTGEPDHTFFFDQKAIGTIDAKPAGHPLTDVEEQSERDMAEVPFTTAAWAFSSRFSYPSRAGKSRFTNNIDSESRGGPIFVSHKPETLFRSLESGDQSTTRIVSIRHRHSPPLCSR